MNGFWASSSLGDGFGAVGAFGRNLKYRISPATAAYVALAT